MGGGAGMVLVAMEINGKGKISNSHFRVTP